MKYPGGSRERDCPDERPMAWKVFIDDDLDNRAMMITIAIQGSTKKMVFLGIIPKPVDHPLGTFRNKNVTFGQKRPVFKAKNNGHHFT